MISEAVSLMPYSGIKKDDLQFIRRTVHSSVLDLGLLYKQHNCLKDMKKQTLAIHQPYKRRDAYDALSMPVYNAVAFEFDNTRHIEGLCWSCKGNTDLCSTL